VWGWLAGLAGFIALGAVLPDPDGDSTQQQLATSDTTNSESTVVATVSVEPTDAPQSTVTVTTAAPIAPVVSEPVTTVPGSVRALDVLNFITVGNEHQADYNRDLFGYPGDLDGNGCDTRDDVLARDSLVPTQTDAGGCTVIAGQWYSAYDDVTSSDPGQIQIDHVVALKEAWDSGAWAWDNARQQRFGNDLEDIRTLRAVNGAANDDKGDADPSNWIPPNDAAVCQYLADWIAIKVRWTLSMDQSEFGRIRNLLTDRCPDQLIAPWPDTPPPPTTLPPTTTVAVTTVAPATTPAPLPPPPPVTQPFFPPTPTAAPSGDCDPSYPDVCIPSPPPDLDCGDIPYRRFTVIGDDPHRFDGDDDGIGCESG
jgi:hypothetical protein